MGYAQATSTTITTNTQTTTTTTNTNLAALHTRIDDLLLEQVDGGNVNQKVQAIEELLQGIQTRQVVDANTITDMKATIGSLEQGKAQMGEELAALKAALSETTARLDGFLTTPNRPGTVSGGCDAGGSCTPPAITAGVDPATGALTGRLPTLWASTLVLSSISSPLPPSPMLHASNAHNVVVRVALSFAWSSSCRFEPSRVEALSTGRLGCSRIKRVCTDRFVRSEPRCAVSVGQVRTVALKRSL